MQYFIQLSLFLLAGSTTLADLIRAVPRAAIPELNSLTRRQFCPYSLEICFSGNGDSVCQEADEVCCQIADGTNPFTCMSASFLSETAIGKSTLNLTTLQRPHWPPLLLPPGRRWHASLRLRRPMHRYPERRTLSNCPPHRNHQCFCASVIRGFWKDRVCGFSTNINGHIWYCYSYWWLGQDDSDGCYRDCYWELGRTDCYRNGCCCCYDYCEGDCGSGWARGVARWRGFGRCCCFALRG